MRLIPVKEFTIVLVEFCVDFHDRSEICLDSGDFAALAQHYLHYEVPTKLCSKLSLLIIEIMLSR